MQSLRCILFVLLAAMLYTPVVAWDPFGIFQSARNRIEEAGDHLIGKAKEAFEQAMQDVFDKEINPLIDKVNAMILEDADEIKKDVEEVVHKAMQDIDAMIDHAAAVAQSLMDHEIDEIKRQIIDETAEKVNECLNNFFKGVNGVLQNFYKTVVKINCMAQGDIDKVYMDIYKIIGKGCWLPDACCWAQGVPFRGLSSMGDSQLYGLEVCRRSSHLTEKTRVSELIKAYMDNQVIAKKFYCVDFGTGAARDYFTKEYNAWGVKYNFWAHRPGRSQVSARPDIAAGRGLDEPCGTALECYQLAISKIDNARQEISDKLEVVKQEMSSKVDVKDAVPAEEQLALFYGSKCPSGWLEAGLSKGYILTGRPEGGKVGAQLNRPFSASELGRVPAHTHDVLDAGHTHSTHVADPGHAHSSSFRTQPQSGLATNCAVGEGGDITVNTNTVATGIEVKNEASLTGLQVKSHDGEFYPLVYVLVCQKAPAARVSEAPSNTFVL